MKAYPILFSTPMVQAILEGRKTQTRRVIKLDGWSEGDPLYETSNVGLVKIEEMCPYGQVGDRLWVRETFVLENTQEYHKQELLPTDRPFQAHQDDVYGSYFLIPHYRATEPEPNIVTHEQDDEITRWQPSIFMPRWASRITLEITDIRVQRVQEITPEDCIAEGLYISTKDGLNLTSMDVKTWYKRRYELLWDSINEKRGYGWDKNPFVWAITFKVVK